MKRKIIKRTIGLMITIIIAIFIISVNSIINGAKKTYTIVDGNGDTRSLTSGEEYYLIWASSGTAASTKVLNQPNVWCAQHGRELSDGNYSPSTEKTVEDSELAYILYTGSTKSGLESNWETKEQKALWYYLNTSSSKDKEYITGAISIDSTYRDGKITCGHEGIQSVNTDAVNYANQINNFQPKVILSLDGNNVKVNVTGYAGKYNVYINDSETAYQLNCNSKNIYIPIEKFTNGTANVKITSSINKYTVKYRVLINDGQGVLHYGPTTKGRTQRLLVVTETDSSKETKTATATLELIKNVSMQKYITSVSDINGNNKITVDSRDSWLSSEADVTNGGNDSAGVIYKEKYYKAPNKNKALINTYKQQNPVKIDYGDKVTYTIEVSNNENYAVSNIIIRDILPQDVDHNVIVGDYSITNAPTGYTIKQGDIKTHSTEKYNYIDYTIDNSISANSSISFTVTMTFSNEKLKNHGGDLFANTAWVESANGVNGTNLKRDYRTADRDYVQMKEYEVNLEKYVSEVTHKDGTKVKDSNIDAERYYEEKYDFDSDGVVDQTDADLLANKIVDKDITNEEIRKKIKENGDITGDRQINSFDVSKLVNRIQGIEEGAKANKNIRSGKRDGYEYITGPKKTTWKQENPVYVEPGDYVTFTIKIKNTGNTQIKIKEIKDTFTSKTNKKLEFQGINGISGVSYRNDKITFTSPVIIEAGGSQELKVKFKVTIDTSVTNATQDLENYAEIERIYNRNDLEVKDSDGDTEEKSKQNNKDKDYLRTKLYEVNLEKYVSEVTHTDGTKVVDSNIDGERYYEEKYDFDSDGVVDYTDVLLLAHKSIDKNITNEEIQQKVNANGDIDNSGSIDANDSLILSLRISGKIEGTKANKNMRSGKRDDYNYPGMLSTSTWKKDNPVYVEPGDYVTFTIKIKNTGNTQIKIKEIKDTFTNQTNKKLEFQGINGISGVSHGNDKITFTSPVIIEAGGSKELKVKFKVTIDTSVTNATQDLENYAEIERIYNRNDLEVKDSDGDTEEKSKQNNKDKDYLNTKIYAVSLEKFVSAVKSQDDERAHELITDVNNSKYNCDRENRSGHPTYNNDGYKEANRVRVEPGDKVTFILKVTNTGENNKDYGGIKTVTIKDTTTNGLSFNGCNKTYTKLGDSITITLDKTIQATQEANIEVYFDVPTTNTERYIQYDNKAQITKINNTNGFGVNDSKESTDADNKDSDYLLTKIYKVALEKYVTKVNDNDLSTIAGESYNVKELISRNGKPTYDSTAKENDIVNLETGDKVTFAITVKNIGDDYINYGTIKTLKIIDESSDKLIYNNVCTGGSYSNGEIKEISPIDVGKETTISLEYMVQLDEGRTKHKVDLFNKATIDKTTIENKNDVKVKEDSKSRGDVDNEDSDYLRTKIYAVSLEKFVSKIEMNGKDITSDINMGPKKDDMRYREGFAEHNYNNIEKNDTNFNKTKRNNPVTTVTGDKVTYTIVLKNESIAKAGVDTNKESNEDTQSYNTAITIGKIKDYLPNGMKYGDNGYTTNKYGVTYDFKTDNEQILTSSSRLEPGNTATVTITAEVIEDKMSLNILKNVAEIDENSLTNRNTKKVYDTTTNNNRDADYIQLNYKHDPNPNNPNANPDSDDNNAFFAGTVWNDMALDKEHANYNTTKDDSEKKLSGITVDLYRNSYTKKNSEMNYTPETKLIVATKTTDENGKYSFNDEDITDNVKNPEKFIKGPKISADDNRWAGYYKYYIVFTYDGITYTSTNDGTYFEKIYASEKDYTKDSNAAEGNVTKISGYETRQAFNSKFATINNSTRITGKEIQYDTVNESGYIPESRYKYDPEIMSMKSLTELIDLSQFIEIGTNKCLECSKHIGLGLRGKDIFDLELTSDVAKVEVKVNGVTGTYDYTNKIGVRRSDVDADYYQDMANRYNSQMNDAYVGELNGQKGQEVRQLDLECNKTLQPTDVAKYDDSQLLQSIFVTYQIKVTNASKTDGKATKIINYFDKCYKKNNIKVYGGTISSVNTHENYNSVLINADADTIRITYELNNARDELKKLGDAKLTTYNMAEIYEYTTTQYENTEDKCYTKGIIDKDSAPGSVAIETARLTEGSTTDTTLDYYFKGTALNKLKYEDDTYATPTLYFTTPGSIRILEGTVFEDYTSVYGADRTRTGNGIQDPIEPGIQSATVELLEKCNNDTIYNAAADKNKCEINGEKYVVRYRQNTNNNGKYQFVNYLPGNYIMRYYYGHNQDTFYIGSINKKSYNGEDFQSTNNYKEVAGADVKMLPTAGGTLWYSYNKDGVSTATDNSDRRDTVSNDACDLSDNEMENLNDVRDGKIGSGKEITNSTLKTLRQKLEMNAETPEFQLTVEQADDGVVKTEFGNYYISTMNFGIAEVPVTTIDLQKHVDSFEIKDSTGENTIASANITNTYIVEINEHNITDENKYNKVKKALENSSITSYIFKEYNTTNYGDAVEDKRTTIGNQVEEDKINKLRAYLITYSIPNIITITPNWETKGNVLTGLKSTDTVLDVSIEDAKLQGAKLQVTYNISVAMYAETDFGNNHPLEPSIEKVVDMIDNGLSYSENLNSNNTYWNVISADTIQYGDKDALQDFPISTKNTTIVDAKSNNDLLKVKAGYTQTTYITLERVLTSTDSTVEDIITSSIDTFEYQNTIRIMQLDYSNTVIGTKKNKDRIRTPERYIIVPGKHHDTATSEFIAIHPPTGDTGISTTYYIIAAIGLVILAVGAFGIKKIVIKNKKINSK